MTDPSFIFDERDRLDAELEQREPPPPCGNCQQPPSIA